MRASEFECVVRRYWSILVLVALLVRAPEFERYFGPSDGAIDGRNRNYPEKAEV
jgi:hypothetical protein